MPVYYVGAWCPRKPEEGVGSAGTKVTDNCELPCRCWGTNLGPQQDNLGS